MGLKPISVCVHDFSVCLLYFFSTQNLVPLKVGHRSTLAARSRERGARFPTAAGRRFHEVATSPSLVQQPVGFAQLKDRWKGQMGRGCLTNLALPALPIIGVVPATRWVLQVACYTVLLVLAEIASALHEEQRQIIYCCTTYIAVVGKTTKKQSQKLQLRKDPEKTEVMVGFYPKTACVKSDVLGCTVCSEKIYFFHWR